MRNVASSAALWLVLFLSAPASIADTASPRTPPTVAMPGRSKSCLQYYSSKAIAMRAQGTTRLAFTIGVDGIPRDISVDSSSGNADLDDAALTCIAKDWRYIPATQDGEPVAVPWKASVTWALRGVPEAGPTIAPLASPPTDADLLKHSTCDAWYPEHATLADPVRPTILAVTIAKDGHVHDAKVAASNGGTEFDSAAIACANHLQIGPLTSSGKPVDVDWKLAILWRKGGRSYYAVPHLPLACSQAYPARALGSRKQGTTVVAFHIARDGSVSDVRTTQSSGSPDLDLAATKCTGNWTFAPWTAEDSSIVQLDYQAQTIWSMKY